MVIGVHYNIAALGEGLSGCVVDLHDDVAVKIYHLEGLHEPRLHRDREAHFLRELEGFDLVSPRYIAQGMHSDLRMTPAPTLTMSRLHSRFKPHDEVIIGRLDSLSSLGDLMGSQLAKLHALAPARFPEDKQKTVLQTMLEQTRTFDVKAESRDWFYNDLTQRLESMEKQVRPVFCHGDFNFSNVGFNAGTKAPESLIDFAYSGYGMPETDFLYLQEPELLEASVASYFEVSQRNISLERLQMVGLVNNMRAFVTFEKYLADGTTNEDRDYWEKERNYAHEDILGACQSLGVVNFVFTGQTPQGPT